MKSIRLSIYLSLTVAILVGTLYYVGPSIGITQDSLASRTLDILAPTFELAGAISLLLMGSALSDTDRESLDKPIKKYSNAYLKNLTAKARLEEEEALKNDIEREWIIGLETVETRASVFVLGFGFFIQLISALLDISLSALVLVGILIIIAGLGWFISKTWWPGQKENKLRGAIRKILS
jgi:hypothetical protein